jgi:hypothetical protein
MNQSSTCRGSLVANVISGRHPDMSMPMALVQQRLVARHDFLPCLLARRSTIPREPVLWLPRTAPGRRRERCR